MLVKKMEIKTYESANSLQKSLARDIQIDLIICQLKSFKKEYEKSRKLYPLQHWAKKIAPIFSKIDEIIISTPISHPCHVNIPIINEFRKKIEKML